jgi:hypothetical protein
MQNKLPHPNKTARLFGVSESFLKPNRWAKAKIPAPLGAFPLDTSPLGTPSLERVPLGGVFCFFSKAKHSRHHCTGPTFQGENMIDTHIRHLPIGSALWVASYRQHPIGSFLFFFPKPAHIAYRCIGTTFRGENIINTHLISFAWFARAFVCVVFVTAQTKALRNGIHAYRTHWDGHHGDA